MSQRRARGGGLGGPAGAGVGPGNPGARGALLLTVAVILGIVLLQQFDSGIDTGGQVATDAGQVDDETTTTRPVGLTTVPTTAPTTTAAARPKSDVRVLVANGAGVRGLGASTTAVLRGLGYATLTPTDTTGGNVDRTQIHYAEGYATEAREIAAALTLPATAAIPQASPPVAAADLGDAKVIVILGTDVPNSATTTTAATGTTSTTRR